MVFKFAYFVEFIKGYHPANCQGFRLSGFRLQKHNDDVIMASYFETLVISYQSANFQIPQLSESNFTEVFYKTPQKPLWRHCDVTSQYLSFKIAHFVELNRRYQPAIFHWPRLS